MSTFAGVCVGGPYAGRWMAGEAEVMRVRVLGPVMPPDKQVSIYANIKTYVFKRVYGVDMWVLSEIINDKGLGGVIAELVNGYHPPCVI